MNKHNRLVEFRWPALATLVLSAFLPGCPVTDNYFIDLPSAGTSSTLPSGGMAELGTAGMSSIAGGPGAGSVGGAPAVHPDHMGSDPLGGGGKDSDTGMPDAGSGDAGSSDGGSSSAGSGGRGASGGQGTTGGSASGGGSGPAGGNTSGGSSNGGANNAGGPNLPQPVCDDGVGKGDPCGPNGAPTCYKGCGPDNIGYKPLTCQLGMYDEPQQGCTFPTHDYSCYKLPTSLPAECPSGMPRGGRACSISTCKVCFGGSVFAPQYQDSMGVQKQGYCVCSEAGVWTCGSNNGSWPCPDGPGCH